MVPGVPAYHPSMHRYQCRSSTFRTSIAVLCAEATPTLAIELGWLAHSRPRAVGHSQCPTDAIRQM